MTTEFLKAKVHIQNTHSLFPKILDWESKRPAEEHDSLVREFNTDDHRYFKLSREQKLSEKLIVDNWKCIISRE